jgi:hypothetical protein
VDLSHIQATDLSLLPTSSSQFVCRLTMFFDCTLADPSSLILPVILLGAVGILRHLIPLSPPLIWVNLLVRDGDDVDLSICHSL